MCSKPTISVILKLITVIKLHDFCMLIRINWICFLLQAYYNLDLKIKKEAMASLKTGKRDAVHYCKMMQLWVILGKSQWFCASKGRGIIIIQFFTELSYVNQLTESSATSPAETPLLERLKAVLCPVPLLWSNCQVACQLNVWWTQPQNICLAWPQPVESSWSIQPLIHLYKSKRVSNKRSKPTPKRSL